MSSHAAISGVTLIKPDISPLLHAYVLTWCWIITYVPEILKLCLQKHFASLILRLLKVQTSDQDNTISDYVVVLCDKMDFLFLHSQSLTVWIAVLCWNKHCRRGNICLGHCSISLTFAQCSMTPRIFFFFSHSVAAIADTDNKIAVSRQMTPALHVCAHTWLLILYNMTQT